MLSYLEVYTRAIRLDVAGGMVEGDRNPRAASSSVWTYRAVRALGSLVHEWSRGLRLRREYRRTLEAVAPLDDRLLADIGLTRSVLADAARAAAEAHVNRTDRGDGVLAA